ncbi:hypothetical protein ACFYE1_16060 [Kocuria sp. CPCC 205315]
MYDMDGTVDVDPTVLDRTGPNGQPDNVWDANFVTKDGLTVLWIDLDQNSCPDAYGYDFSTIAYPSHSPLNHLPDFFVFDTNEDGVIDETNPVVDWSQYPSELTGSGCNPGPGEVCFRENAEGTRDLIIGPMPGAPFGGVAGEWHRTDPCYDYLWTDPSKCPYRA